MAKTRKKETAVSKVEPARSMGPLEEMEHWFDEAFPRAWMHRWGWPSWNELSRPMERMAPRMDVVEHDDEVVVRAEVPGVKKEDLDVSVTGNAVTVKGTTKREDRQEKGDYYRCEIAQGSFSRTVGLPGEIDPDKVKASFDDGVLELRLPKVTKAKRRSVKLD